ncbi:MAG: glutathione S-transferase [Piscinibacter sp.]|nr:glutathione S-transferase [Piscinibacter sp.]
MTRTAAPQRPIRVYTFPLSGHAHRAELFLSLLGLPFERVEVDLVRRAHKQPEFLALNPFGKVPVIDDDGTVIADSHAILVYLAQRYDAGARWLPSDPVGAAEVQRWLALSAGPLVNGAAAARWDTLTGKTVAPAVQATARDLLGQMQSHLAGRDWLVGASPTIADVALYSYTAHVPEGGVALEPYPAVQAWLARIEALPGFIDLPRGAALQAALRAALG